MESFPAGQELPTSGNFLRVEHSLSSRAEFALHLHEDDRLTIEAVADLADRLPRQSVIYDTAAQPLLVPQGGFPRGVLPRPGDVIRDLENANAWLTLLNIEADPAYADLMNTLLDELDAMPPARHQEMRHRVGFVFVSSPNSGRRPLTSTSSTAC